MAIVTPAALVVTPESALVLPTMAHEPLQTAMRNANRAWSDYGPPLVSLAPHSASSGSERAYRVGVEPSADSLAYSTRWAVEVSGACNLTWKIEQNDGGWSEIDSGVHVAAGAGVERWTNANLVVSATATELRYRVTPSAGTARVHHVLTWPAPGAPIAGITASGYRPYDDGLLGTAEAPITTEHVRRAWRNAAILLRDRKPMVVSFAQIATGTALWRYTSAQDATMVLARARCRLPGAVGVQTLGVHVLAEVSAGGTADLVRVAQVPSASGAEMAQVKFAADGAPHSADLAVQVEGTGLSAFVDIAVLVGCTAGHLTTMRSLSAIWRPA